MPPVYDRSERIKAEIATASSSFDRMFSLLPTSRAGRKIYLSIWDLFWALTCPIFALYIRGGEALFEHIDLQTVLQYWGISAGFALIAFFAFRLQDGMTRHFSFQEAIDIAEAVLFAQLLTCAVLFTWSRLDGIPRSAPLIHGFLLGAGLIAARIVVRIATSDYQRNRPIRIVVSV